MIPPTDDPAPSSLPAAPASLPLAPDAGPPGPRALAGMAAASVLWLLLARYLLPAVAPHAPMALQKAVSWTTFRALGQVAVLLLGLAAWAALVPRGLPRLGLRAPSPRALLGVGLASPAVWAAATYTALAVALPTLMEELRTRGPGASRQNAGAFGAELTSASLPAMLLAGVALAALSEELLFRGALWTTLDGLLNRFVGAPTIVAELGPRPGDRLRGWLVGGWGATLAAGLAFGALHADVPGGVGIVRVVSTTLLGLAAGAARTLSGSLWAAVALHALHNTLSLGQSRGWFAGLGPSVYGAPAAVLAAAAAGLLGLVALRLAGRRAAPGSAGAAQIGE